MSDPKDPRQEHPSTYMVQDRSSTEEMMRLQMQDQLLNTSMGGVLAEQANPTHFRRVLDVGCGAGGWLIETAQTYPDISVLIGVDISSKMLGFARAQAALQQVGNRLEFLSMDALRMLEFPNAFFDLVNQRLGASYLRTWDWPKLLQEYQRVVRPGGIIRITESDWITGNSDSPALAQLRELALQAHFHAGHLAHPVANGVTSALPDLCQQHGIQHVQTRPSLLTFHAGTTAGLLFVEDVARLFRNIKPFLQKWTSLPDDYDEIYQQMLNEMNNPNFVGNMKLLTVWGTRA